MWLYFHAAACPDGIMIKMFVMRLNIFAGTVWVNSYIDESMKHATIEDVKLRVCVQDYKRIASVTS